MAEKTTETFKRTITDFPMNAKVVTASSNFLTDNSGVRQWMTIYVGTGGTVTVVPLGNADDHAVAFVVPDGGVIPVRVKKVTAVVTAAGLVGVW
jgi:hypothetical protein